MYGYHLSVNDLHLILSESDIGGISVSTPGTNDSTQDSFVIKVALTHFLPGSPEGKMNQTFIRLV